MSEHQVEKKSDSSRTCTTQCSVGPAFCGEKKCRYHEYMLRQAWGGGGRRLCSANSAPGKVSWQLCDWRIDGPPDNPPGNSDRLSITTFTEHHRLYPRVRDSSNKASGWPPPELSGPTHPRSRRTTCPPSRARPRDPGNELPDWHFVPE